MKRKKKRIAKKKYKNKKLKKNPNSKRSKADKFKYIFLIKEIYKFLFE
tara:strand:+ start:21 stop:164 length:144 start_codon:yes stop_codon:yes gene_type:complete